MFYIKGKTAGYITEHYFRLEHFLFDHFVYLSKAKFMFSVTKSFGGETCLIRQQVFKLKSNCLNNRDFNIDQNNRDYDFSHILAALQPCLSCY